MSDQLRVKLVDFIDSKVKSSGKTIPDNFDDDSPLITSGLLESLYLLEMALLIEEEIGTSLDLTILDFTKEWNTINSIIEYVRVQISDSGSQIIAES
jgi:acyl carrier protein